MTSPPSPAQARKILEDFKIEMVVDFDSNKFQSIRTISKEGYKLANEYEAKNLNGDPIYESIKKERNRCDLGDRFLKPNYTPIQEKFLESEKYKKLEKILDKAYDDEQKEKNAVIRRLKSGNMTPEEKEVLNKAEITIWEKETDFFGDKHKDSPTKNYPVITFDSTYYEIMNGYWGYDFRDKVVENVKKRLNNIGLFFEPYDSSTWVLAKK